MLTEELHDLEGACAWVATAELTASTCFFFQAEDGIRDLTVTGVQTCALPIFCTRPLRWASRPKQHYPKRNFAGNDASSKRFRSKAPATPRLRRVAALTSRILCIRQGLAPFGRVVLDRRSRCQKSNFGHIRRSPPAAVR